MLQLLEDMGLLCSQLRLAKTRVNARQLYAQLRSIGVNEQGLLKRVAGVLESPQGNKAARQAQPSGEQIGRKSERPLIALDSSRVLACFLQRVSLPKPGVRVIGRELYNPGKSFSSLLVAAYAR